MKYKNKRAVLYALLISLITTKVSGCGYSENKTCILAESLEDYKSENKEEIQKLVIEDITPNVETTSEPVIQEEKEQPLFKEISSVIATTNVNIRKAPIDGDLVGKLVEGHTLEMIEELSNGWYKVLYYGNECYVSGDYATKTTTYQVNGVIKKVCYATHDIEITIPKEVSKSGVEENMVIPRLECLEIYEENEDNYLVQTEDYIGYVAKTSLEELTGTFVVVDISNQELKLYENNKVILETPVVTGNTSKKGCASDEGLFAIYAYKYNNYLIGRDKYGNITYQSYVDIMMYYNRGEGLHDAEYHTCDNGKDTNHGWRNASEFGGNTYLTNGSHGCVNMPHDAVFEVAEHVSEGTPVLVKK